MKTPYNNQMDTDAFSSRAPARALTSGISTMADAHFKNCEELNKEHSQPLCTQCLTPFEPLQHYCSKCGSTVGNYTRYIPFVNIPFYVEFSAKVWEKFWRSDNSILSKIGLFPIVIFLWGPLFLVGLPFELWRKYKK